jgi:DNA-binding protein HU-beta
VNKKDMAAALADRAGLSHVKANELLNHIFDADEGVIAQSLAGGDKVLVAGFGTFATKTRAGRTGTNPSTGARIKIAPKNYVSFKAGKNLKEAISG